jgi:hypothetical protein
MKTSTGSRYKNTGEQLKVLRNKGARFFLILLLLFSASYLFAFSWPEDRYMVVNESGSNVLLIAKLKDISDMHRKIKYCRDHIYITTLILSWYTDYNKDLIPPSYPERSLFKIEQDLHLFTPPEEIPEAIPYIDVFRYLLEVFIIYDAEGNVVMTLDDVTEDSLTINKLAPDFSTSSVHIKIVITPETVEAGRRKYAGRKE